MVLISDYIVVRSRSGLEECISQESPLCPVCGKPLKYRDSRVRIYKSYNGRKHLLRIRRLKCGGKDGCGRLHNELPEFIIPYKHYASEIIENVIDGVSTPCDPTTEDYPCEKTMQRWAAWFSFYCCLFEITARCLGKQRLFHLQPAGKEGRSVLSVLRLEGTGWLSFLIRYIYNCGGRLPAGNPEAFFRRENLS